MPRKPANPAEAVTEIRAQIADLQFQQRELVNTPVSAAEIESAVDHYIERAATRYRDNHVTSILTSNARLSDLAIKADPEAFAAFMFGDTIKARLLAATTDKAAGGIHADERVKRQAKLSADLHAAEVLEEQTIRQAESDGLEVTRRPDADPKVVLGLSGDQ